MARIKLLTTICFLISLSVVIATVVLAEEQQKQQPQQQPDAIKKPRSKQSINSKRNQQSNSKGSSKGSPAKTVPITDERETGARKLARRSHVMEPSSIHEHQENNRGFGATSGSQSLSIGGGQQSGDSWHRSNLMPTYADQEQGDEMIALADETHERTFAISHNKDPINKNNKDIKSSGTQAQSGPVSMRSIGHHNQNSELFINDEYYNDSEEEDSSEDGSDTELLRGDTERYNKTPVHDPESTNTTMYQHHKQQSTSSSSSLPSTTTAPLGDSPSKLPILSSWQNRVANKEAKSSQLNQTTAINGEQIGQHQQKLASLLSSRQSSSLNRANVAIEYLRSMLKGRNNENNTLHNSNDQSNSMDSNQHANFQRLSSIANRLNQILAINQNGQSASNQSIARPTYSDEIRPEPKSTASNSNNMTSSFEQMLRPATYLDGKFSVNDAKFPTNSQAEKLSTLPQVHVSDNQQTNFQDSSSSIPFPKSAHPIDLTHTHGQKNGTPLGGDYMEHLDDYPRTHAAAAANVLLKQQQQQQQQNNNLPNSNGLPTLNQQTSPLFRLSSHGFEPESEQQSQHLPSVSHSEPQFRPIPSPTTHQINTPQIPENPDSEGDFLLQAASQLNRQKLKYYQPKLSISNVMESQHPSSRFNGPNHHAYKQHQRTESVDVKSGEQQLNHSMKLNGGLKSPVSISKAALQVAAPASALAPALTPVSAPTQISNNNNLFSLGVKGDQGIINQQQQAVDQNEPHSINNNNLNINSYIPSSQKPTTIEMSQQQQQQLISAPPSPSKLKQNPPSISLNPKIVQYSYDEQRPMVNNREELNHYSPNHHQNQHLQADSKQTQFPPLDSQPELVATNYELADALYSSSGSLEQLLSDKELEAIKSQLVLNAGTNDLKALLDGHHKSPTSPVAYPSALISGSGLGSLPDALPPKAIVTKGPSSTTKPSVDHNQQQSELLRLDGVKTQQQQQQPDLSGFASELDSKSLPKVQQITDNPQSDSSSSLSKRKIANNLTSYDYSDFDIKSEGAKGKSLIVYLNHPKSDDHSHEPKRQHETDVSGSEPIEAKEIDSYGISKDLSKKFDISSLDQDQKDGLSVVVIGDAWKYKKIILLISSKPGGPRLAPMLKDLR